MSNGRLPDRIDPLRVAETQRELKGSLAVSEMPRLASMLADPSGEVQVELAGGVDKDGVRVLRGRLRAEVSITCQRCLEAFRLPLESEVNLGIVTHEALAERLPEGYEPLVAGEEPVLLREIVEDELILALPLVPKHADEACASEGATADEIPEEGRRANPFATLIQLKTTRKS